LNGNNNNSGFVFGDQTTSKTPPTYGRKTIRILSSSGNDEIGVLVCGYMKSRWSI